MTVELPPEVAQAMPGAAGSAIAAWRWFPGPWYVKVATWMAGIVASYMGALFASWYFGLASPAGLGTVGFFTGLFGVLAMDKVQEFVRSAEVGEVWKALMALLRKWLGVQGG
jgi:hypothetical protein